MDRRLWRTGVTGVLATGLLAATIVSPRAGEHASADDTARLLAGMQPAQSSPVAALTRDGSWQRHAKRFDTAWSELETRQLSKIRAWSAERLPQRQPVVYYMFSGPDFLYADAFFSDASTFVLSGLEPVGPVPDVEGLPQRALSGELGRLQGSLNSVLSFSFFITKKMKTQLKGGRLTGTLPILYVFLARSGHTIEDVSLIALEPDGSVHPASDEKAGTRAQGAKIVFSGKDGKERTLYYFSTDLSNDGVDKSGFLAFCAGLGRGDALLKSASYLLHSDNFSKVRDFMLDHSDAVVQDDSGIPVRFFKPEQWQLYPFGNYVRPLSIFPRAYQPQLNALYHKEHAGPLDFGIGYHWRPRQSNLLLAVKSKKTAQDER